MPPLITHKRISATASLLGALSLSSFAQLPSQNYVLTRTFLNASGSRCIEEAQIYDGLGRPSATSTLGAGENGKRVYTLLEYDGRGQAAREWLPVAGGSQAEAITAERMAPMSSAFYSDTKAFAANTYDALGRKTGVQTPGEAWHAAGKRKTISYGTNAGNSVRRYTASGAPGYSLRQDGFYPSGDLIMERATDEDGTLTETYTDFTGNKILERRNGGNDTYFVYDPYQRLSFVLSPEYQRAGYKAKYAYGYRYDDRGNVVKRILPGCEAEQYWYDPADRMAFMQDATLREKGLYRFFLYDIFGRLAVQGTCAGCVRTPCLNTARPSQDVGFCGTGYSIPFPGNISGAKIESAVYYDNYGFIDRYTSEDGFAPDLFKSEGICSMGKQTGQMAATSSGGRILSAIYYNGHGLPSDRIDLHAGKRLKTEHTEYSYTMKPTSVTTTEYAIAGGRRTLTASRVLESAYSEQNDKLKPTAVTVNGKTATAAACSYDDLGRIKTTERGAAGTVSYGYDLHGWTTTIASREFTENLHYADGVGMPCYNGNISSMLWQTPDYPQKRGYKFTYDPLNRLAEAVYGEGENLSDKRNRYNEKVLEYTANGAMKRFQRRGRKDDGEYGKIDNLSIKLQGNQLLSVTDDAQPANKYSSMNFVDGANEDTEYEYNGVGALTKDLNRGLTIEYDNLNNPQFMQFRDGNTILYDYSSDGTLLSKTYGAHKAEPLSAKSAIGKEEESKSATGSILTPTILYSGTTEYSGDFIYKDGRLDKVLFPGGYCTFDHETLEPQFHYFTQDHLGNNRAVVSESGEVEQITHYYPFGGTFCDAGLNPALQHYKYNGMELDRVAGLNTLDFGARQYYPFIPTWDRMDKMCEKYYNVSPYVYCHNLPVLRIDYNGYYDFKNIINGFYYEMIGIFQSCRDEILEKDYQEAVEVGLPVVTVDIISDLTDALSDLNEADTSFETLIFNSHGKPGSFLIGSDVIDIYTDVEMLNKYTSDKTIFINACNVGLNSNDLFLPDFSYVTNSNVIASCHKILAGYRYDGGSELNYFDPNIPLFSLDFANGNRYVMSQKGSSPINIYNLTLDMKAGINWSGKYQRINAIWK